HLPASSFFPPRPPPYSPLFPYTTLFRSFVSGSVIIAANGPAARLTAQASCSEVPRDGVERLSLEFAIEYPCALRARTGTRWRTRSEEHTSELQSQSNLVCRLLLEKKKKK